MREITRHRFRLAEAAAQLARVELELRVRGPRRNGVTRLLGAPTSDTASVAADPAKLGDARRVGFAVVRAAARLPWEPACLAQAVACQRMLRRRGIAGRLELGVARPGRFEAHAWVTVQGESVVGQAEAGRFTPLASFQRFG